jgi:hypothetical protein
MLFENNKVAPNMRYATYTVLLDSQSVAGGVQAAASNDCMQKVLFCQQVLQKHSRTAAGLPSFTVHAMQSPGQGL